MLLCTRGFLQLPDAFAVSNVANQLAQQDSGKEANKTTTTICHIVL
jgi:hypothetical protein